MEEGRNVPVWDAVKLPSKHVGSSSYPVRIGSEAGQMILAYQLVSGLDMFGKNLTQSARIKSALGWLRTTWSRTSVKKRNWVWMWGTGSGPVYSKNPDQAIHIRSGSVLHYMIHAFFGKIELNQMRDFGSGIYDSAWFCCTLAVMAVTGCNQDTSGSDPACLLGMISVYFTDKILFRRVCLKTVVLKSSRKVTTNEIWDTGLAFCPWGCVCVWASGLNWGGKGDLGRGVDLVASAFPWSSKA